MARERSQLPDLSFGTLSLKISVLPPTSTVLNVAPKLIILTFILICLRHFVDCNAWQFRLVVGRAINNLNNNNNNNNNKVP